MNIPCHICGNGRLTLVPEYSSLKRVTSDCKPWPAGGRLGICQSCSTAQAVIDDTWRDECRQIYGAYTIYHQADGKEQPVYNPSSGIPSARSDYLLDNLAKAVAVPKSGRLLDIGCGNGGFLRSFSKKFPHWQLNGSEYDGKYRAQVESIPGFESLFLGDIAGISGSFNAISLIHVFEHIESPHALLQQVQGKLKSDGILVIELPYFVENPFVLAVADHATHFDAATIRTLLARSDFSPLHVTSDWIPKELSIVAQKQNPVAASANLTPVSPVAAIRWLESVRRHAADIAKLSKHFGIFGTSIAGNWLYAELNRDVEFFVDEDLNRTGKKMNGCPVIAPADVPPDSDIYIALPRNLVNAVMDRTKNAPGRYHAPPG